MDMLETKDRRARLTGESGAHAGSAPGAHPSATSHEADAAPITGLPRAALWLGLALASWALVAAIVYGFYHLVAAGMT